MNENELVSASDWATSGRNRDLYENNTHPFIVKIWLEETAEEAGQATWRGHITHVPTGKRCYMQHLDEIVAFIADFLREMGVES